MKIQIIALALLTSFSIQSQDNFISGKVFDGEEAIAFANVILYSTIDSTIRKVETTDNDGLFLIKQVEAGQYYIDISFIGYDDFRVNDINVKSDSQLDLGKIDILASGIELETAVVTARRAIVEVKPDRTVFNVQGTINSTGDNGLDLLRKAPGVLLDNNNNITVLSRSGVLIYIDGKRLPLTGDDLTNYLQNLTSEQIDRIDIITNPGAKYEAQGNAGIIDIRLKKNENHGTNGSISSNSTRATFFRNNINGNLNMRNSMLNTFAQFGVGKEKVRQKYYFDDFQNTVRINNEVVEDSDSENLNFRWGTDFFIGKNQTIGFLTSGNFRRQSIDSNSDNNISSIATPDIIDSILIAGNDTESDFNSQTINLNYVFDNKKSVLNIDADYGRFRTDNDSNQPNNYFSPDLSTIFTTVNTAYQTPIDIDIYTFKVDYETDFQGGRLGIGTKFSKVATDNTFLFFEIPDQDRILDDRRSNEFFYDENVYAGYISYTRSLSPKWNLATGLRLEHTDATGDLQAFAEDLQEKPVELNYLSYFPSAGLTYTATPRHVFSLNYGRRINRPDYNVLNPFKNQINELSFSKGNPFLSPEIVNNIELGFLLDYRYNFKLAYSRTTDQITRLIGPDDSDPRARFINWDNLAEQITYGLNISAPVQFTNHWNAFFNLSGSHLNNQADYGDGVVVDVQAWTYNIFQQHTINLPDGFVAEVSGWFSGPGVWGGVFKYDTSWSLNLGLQKKFFDNKLNVRLSAQDIFRQAFWSGASEFNGLTSIGMGDWDSRRVAVSFSYNFGNDKVKSRKRDTGIQDETDRVGS